MHMLYNSDNYAVVQFDVPVVDPGAAPEAEPVLTRGGYEIVDKFSRKEIFIEGAMAAQFKADVDALIEQSPTEEDIDAYLSRYAPLAHQPVLMH